jgi:H+/Cl- antiporter ClcA
MAQSEVKLIRKSDRIVDVIAVGAFFAYMFTVVSSHVPSNDPTMVTFWSAGAAACMSGVFWLALNMFRVVARYQKELEKRK